MTAPVEPHRPLRSWQVAGLRAYRDGQPRDFLAAATPGAGKTTFALTLAVELLRDRHVDQVIVVAPTDHLRTQWATEASRAGILLDARLGNAAGRPRAGFHGYVTTYAQVAAAPVVHRRRCEHVRTLVILDEIHHAGDGLSWGEATREAFTPATRRIALTGTPFRTRPEERIPFVSYDQVDTETLQSVPDVAYTYREALADGVARPVVFAAYAGRAKWMNSAGDVLSASLGEDTSKERERAAWRTALNPSGRWIGHVLAAADARLTDLRASSMPAAGGLILANDQQSAHAYARTLKQVTGRDATVVVSDDPASSKRIAQFATGNERWMVAVRMVSEGVDVPRLGVLVWATTYRTPLFFAQAVGRVVRQQRPGESATVFLPAVRPLLALAAAVEDERNHVVRVSPASATGEFPEAIVERVASEPGGPSVTALEAEAEFAHVLSSGRAVVAPAAVSAEEADFLGLPGLLSPEQTAVLLAARDAQVRRAGAGRDTTAPPTALDVDGLRAEVHALAIRLAVRQRVSPQVTHAQVRRAVPGPGSAEAPATVLERRRDWLLARLSD